jgi:hypothetical protein
LRYLGKLALDSVFAVLAGAITHDGYLAQEELDG